MLGIRTGSSLYAQTKPATTFFDKNLFDNAADYRKCLEDSRTVYVGNLESGVTEEQLYAYFRECGDIRRIIVGLNPANKTPCGFCFVEFYDAKSADAATALNGSTPSFHVIRSQHSHQFVSGIQESGLRVNKDTGFSMGRQFERRRQSGGNRFSGRGFTPRRDFRATPVKRSAPDGPAAEIVLPGPDEIGAASKEQPQAKEETTEETIISPPSAKKARGDNA